MYFILLVKILLVHICIMKDTFSDAEERIREILSGSQRRFTCTRCGKRYKHAHILRRHMEYECGVPPKFQCGVCGKCTKVQVISHIKLPDALPIDAASKKRPLEVTVSSGESSKKRVIDSETELVVIEDISEHNKQKTTSPPTKSSDFIIIEDNSRPGQHNATSPGVEVTESSASLEGSAEKDIAPDFIIIEDAPESEKKETVSVLATEVNKLSDCIVIEDSSRSEKQKTTSTVAVYVELSSGSLDGSSEKHITGIESDLIIIEDAPEAEKQKTVEATKSSGSLEGPSESDTQKESSSVITATDKPHSSSKEPSEKDIVDIESDLVEARDSSMPAQENEPIDTEDTESSDSDSVVVIIEDYPRSYSQIKPSPTGDIRSSFDRYWFFIPFVTDIHIFYTSWKNLHIYKYCKRIKQKETNLTPVKRIQDQKIVAAKTAGPSKKRSSDALDLPEKASKKPTVIEIHDDNGNPQITLARTDEESAGERTNHLFFVKKQDIEVPFVGYTYLKRTLITTVTVATDLIFRIIFKFLY
nr:unnamed protein product [Callosobruchus chinensis]